MLIYSGVFVKDFFWFYFSSARSRETGPRATVIHHHRTIAGDRPPRYGEKTPPLTVGRGPVPRHAFGRQTSSPL